MATGHLLIAYDGSEESRRALETAARIFDGADAWVMHVGEAPHPTVVGPAPGPIVPEPPPAALGDALAAAEKAARDLAEEGVELAARLGLRAAPLCALGHGPTEVAAELMRAADEHDVAVVVVGSHQRSAIRRAILGSVSGSVVNHCHRPVLVVPPTSG